MEIKFATGQVPMIVKGLSLFSLNLTQDFMRKTVMWNEIEIMNWNHESASLENYK